MRSLLARFMALIAVTVGAVTALTATPAVAGSCMFPLSDTWCHITNNTNTDIRVADAWCDGANPGPVAAVQGWVNACGTPGRVVEAWSTNPDEDAFLVPAGCVASGWWQDNMDDDIYTGGDPAWDKPKHNFTFDHLSSVYGYWHRYHDNNYVFVDDLYCVPPVVPAPPGGGPVAPQSLEVIATTSTTVTLSWVPVEGLYYRIVRTGLSTTGSPGFKDTGLVPSTTYSYTVKGCVMADTVEQCRSASVNATTNASTGGGVSNPAIQQVWGDTSGWHIGNTGIDAESTISAVNMGGQWPQIMTISAGKLYQIYGDSSGWHRANTGISIPSGAPISAINMGSQWPQVMTVINGTLHQVWGDTSGWHISTTGISVSGPIAAVNMGSQWPRVMAVNNGYLHQIWGDTSGWHIASTGISIPSGAPISAINMGGQWPQTMTVVNGKLHQIWGDTSGWHIGSTGISVSGPLSAVNTGAGWPVTMANIGGTLHQIWGDTSGWHIGSTGLSVLSGKPVSAVYMGSQWPQVIALG